MNFSLELWASVVNAAIFMSLIAIPWTAGVFRLLVLIIGLGGLACLLGFDFLVGFQKDDFGLIVDLMSLTFAKGGFFLVASYGVERVFRTFLSNTRTEERPSDLQEDETSRRFDRNLRGLKDDRSDIEKK